MKAPTPSPLHPVSSTAQTFDELEAIRARLEDAQRAESDAIRKLDELTRRAESDKATFDKLFAEVRETRQRAVEVYEEWNRTVEKVREDQAERTRKRR
jgi:uncharacterized coiled-coil DUF342 family protein